ncbi:hypothetical protein [Cronobacter sakazakii]|uniref:hypothetical protein n=1 Tax=Cronobacter sakazakii TaxID=28141 RepID=UPI0009449202|nr:hypothetical protein [Cronobacter sakazakii]QXL98278.1 hypothetical protein AUM97_004040 [Cronobacter sakazakii]
MNNDELIAAGHELAKCLDSEPLLDIAKMIVRLADKLEVTTAALREKKKQCEQLAAENAALKEFIHRDCLVPDINGYDKDAADFMPGTPATDEFLREVRAQGVELFSKQQRSYIGNPSKNDAASSYCSREALKFSGQLRQGGAA